MCERGLCILSCQVYSGHPTLSNTDNRNVQISQGCENDFAKHSSVSRIMSRMWNAEQVRGVGSLRHDFAFMAFGGFKKL